MASELEIVTRWHTALNAGDVDTLVALVDPQVEVGGPRGTTQGAEVIREWFGRANVRLVPLKILARPKAIIVEEQGDWLSSETGEVTNSQKVATVFEVRNQLISRIMRYADLETALKEADNLT